MGAGKRGNRLARIGASPIAAATVAAACTAAAASSASATTSGPAKATAVAANTVSARSATPAYVPPSGTLREGSSGAAVKALEQPLASLKYDLGTIDGHFGANTEDAVWAFQEINGVKVTGVIDTATKRALVSPKTDGAHDPRQNGNRSEG